MAKTLRGIVYDRYKSVRAFARAVGWDHNKANCIVNGDREPRVSDLNEMASALDTSVENLAEIFLSSKSQNCD